VSDVEILRAALEAALEGLEGISWKRMFGCDAAFRDGNIFALVWKEGRIGLKYPQADEFETRMAMDDSMRWAPGGRVTRHWLLIPTQVSNSSESLKEWSLISYDTAA